MQDSIDHRAESDPSCIRQLAHELRDALNPLASCVDLARLRGFDVEASRLLAEEVERALRRAHAILDGLVSEPRNAAVEAEREVARQPLPGKACLGPSADPVGANRILIVDDSVEVRRNYREALMALGCTVTEAADAEEALSAVENDPPDVALIDIHLPSVSGFRLARTIRRRSGGWIHLVLLSEMTLDVATRDLAREAGFDDCLDKMAGPIVLRELILSSIARKSVTYRSRPGPG